MSTHDETIVLTGDGGTERIERLLTVLAEAERAGAPAGLARRVWEASVPSLPRPEVIARIDVEQARRARGSLASHGALRMAAAIALLATVGAAVLSSGAGRPAAVGTIAKKTVVDRDWAVLSLVLDDSSSSEIDAIRSEATKIKQQFGSSLDDSLLEGAM